MGKLIAVVGPSVVGKTTLVKVLSRTDLFAVAYEEHTERPFQALFAGGSSSSGGRDKGYGFANQMDYLLLRAEQEKELRASSLIGLTDGGLDLDYHGFARLFHARGLLTDAEFDLCHRFYTLTRQLFPLPELIIRLTASEGIIRQRLAARQRINIATAKDTMLFNSFLEQWLGRFQTTGY